MYCGHFGESWWHFYIFCDTSFSCSYEWVDASDLNPPHLPCRRRVFHISHCFIYVVLPSINIYMCRIKWITSSEFFPPPLLLYPLHRLILPSSSFMTRLSFRLHLKSVIFLLVIFMLTFSARTLWEDRRIIRGLVGVCVCVHAGCHILSKSSSNSPPSRGCSVRFVKSKHHTHLFNRLASNHESYNVVTGISVFCLIYRLLFCPARIFF